MIRLNRNIKIISILVCIAIIVAGIMIWKETIIPSRVTEIKTNEVYMSEGYEDAPSKEESKYYLEVRNDNTYSMYLDITEYYDEFPRKLFVNGTYVKKNKTILFTPNNAVYINSTTKTVLDTVENGPVLSKDGWGLMLMNIYVNKEGEYLLGVSSVKNELEYDESRTFYSIYDKAYIEDLPDTVDEFIEEYKGKK